MSAARYADLMERVVANSVEEARTGCWVWVGNKDKAGYGRMTARVDGAHKKLRVIRVVLQQVTGKDGKGLHAGHACANPSCVNPHHLSWQTVQENSDEMWGRRRARGAL